MTDLVTQDVNFMDPNLQVPYADSWTLGLQRAIGRNMAVEIRYVGTRGRELWDTLNYNEINVFDNGFIQEFRAAQANLRANVAAGLANSGVRLPRARHGNGAAADHVRLLPGCGRSNERRGVHVDEFQDQQQLPDTARDVQPEPVHVRAEPLQQCHSSAPTRRTPAGFPRTSS